MSKPRLAILDADCFMFFAGWEYRERLNLLGAAGAQKKMDKIIQSVLAATNADYYLGFYGNHTGPKNFRYDVATIKPYKGTRSGDAWQEYFKPILKQHYQDKWGFYPMNHIEADDAVIIAHHQYIDDYDIIHVGEDKDMRQLGDFKRYNLRTKTTEHFEKAAGRKFFWSQVLHGDSSDNIGGIEGVGQGKKGGETSKNKIVMALWAMEDPTEEEMFQFVKEAYINKYGVNAQNVMIENYLLLYMIETPSFDYPEEVKLTKYGTVKSYAPARLLNI